MTDQHQPTPAGWYPDPERPGGQRYWDGANWTQTAPPAPPQKKGGAAKIIIPIVACLGLGFILLLVALVVGGDPDEDEAGSRETTSQPASPTGGADTQPSEDEPANEEEPEPGTAERPLAIGTGTRVGDYDVTITAVDLDATETVKGQNTFNDDPTNGLYVMVSISLTYVGDDEGNVSFDLGTTLQGGNGIQYDDYECGASLTNGRGSAPTLTNGGSITMDVCMDVAPEAVEGATLFVEESLSFDDTRAYWATS